MNMAVVASLLLAILSKSVLPEERLVSCQPDCVVAKTSTTLRIWLTGCYQVHIFEVLTRCIAHGLQG